MNVSPNLNNLFQGDGEGMPYELDWGVDDEESGNSYSHVESSDGQTTQGEYRVLLPDGRTQVRWYRIGNFNQCIARLVEIEFLSISIQGVFISTGITMLF